MVALSDAVTYSVNAPCARAPGRSRYQGRKSKEEYHVGKVSPTAAMYHDPDQESVRRDLAVLFGPRSDYYLKEYE